MKERVYWIDATKGILALFVVLGHAIVWSGISLHSEIFQFIYFYVSTFHMAAFFAVSGYVCGRIKRKSGSMEKSERPDCIAIFRRTANLIVPTIIAMGFTFCMVAFLGKFSIRQAISVSLFWFMWVISAINVIHPYLHFWIKSQKNLLVILAGLTLLFGILINDVGKFFGYFFLYELGCFLGSKLTPETEKDFFRLSWGTVACVSSSIVIFVGYVLGGGTLVLNALYKIPIGVVMSYSICSIVINSYTPKYFALAGRFTLQIYLFQFMSVAWIKPYTSCFPVWLNSTIFVIVICFCYFIPVYLANKYENTRVYKIIFQAGETLSTNFLIKI